MKARWMEVDGHQVVVDETDEILATVYGEGVVNVETSYPARRSAQFLTIEAAKKKVEAWMVDYFEFTTGEPT